MMLTHTNKICSVLIASAVALAGCEKAHWEPMSDEETMSVLETHFVGLDEMSNIRGEDYKQFSFGFPEHRRIRFNLPNAMVPQDWLDVLVNECFVKREWEYTKVGAYYFEHSHGGTPQYYRIKYIANTDDYQFEYQVYD